MDSKPKVDVYRVNPTFTLDLNMLEEYRKTIMEQIMHNRFILMRDGRTLKWVDELIVKEKKTMIGNKLEDLKNTRGKA